MLETAVLDVRILPWHPRARVMKPDTLREIADPFTLVDDIQGLIIGLVLWLVVIIAAPVIVLVLAAGLLSVELPIVLAVGLLLLLIRFTGVLPWTVLIIDQVTGEGRRESYRNLWRAVRRIRSVNGDQRVKVRWSWT